MQDIGDTYFKVFRSLLTHDMWLKERFTYGQAWVDLIGLANFGTTESFYRGEYQVIKRGQIKASVGFFEKRWKWSRNRVVHYFHLLEVSQMAQVVSTPRGTTITLEKYGYFQDTNHGKGVTKGVAEGTSEGVAEGVHNKNNKKNNIKEYACAREEDRAPAVDKVVDADGFVYIRGEDGRLECVGRDADV